MTLVAALDLISSKSSYDKNEVRRVRACWGYPLFSFHPGYRIHSLIPIYRSYKQNKFNLLREQPEGFSNFVTEVISPIWKRIVSSLDILTSTRTELLMPQPISRIIMHESFLLILLSLSPWKGQCESLTLINEERSKPMNEEDGGPFKVPREEFG
jgi:hypothetical protein